MSKIPESNPFVGHNFSMQISQTGSLGEIEQKTSVISNSILGASSSRSPNKLLGKVTLVTDSLIKPSKIFSQKFKTLVGREKVYIRNPPKNIIADTEKERLEPVLKDMMKYLMGSEEVKFKGSNAEVLQFLEGKKSLDSLSIDDSNSEEYLMAVKLWDHALATVNFTNGSYNSFSVGSYDLRMHIARVSKLSTHQVFTKTCNPKEFEDWDFLKVQSNWVPERAGIHAKIIQTALIQAISLSKRLDTEKPSIWAVRGNTGSGKTYSIGNDSLFKKSLDEKGEPSGAINPDTFKGLLKKESPEISHAKLHKEGSTLSFQYAEALVKEAVHATMIIDTRLATHNDLEGSVLNPVTLKNGDALLLDIDTPIITSINRVLTRPADGDSPIVPLWAIKEGYEKIRSERSRVIDTVMNNDTVKYYKLYITDDQGKQQLAAKKEKGVFKIMAGMEKAVMHCKQKPEENEVDKIVDQVIDDNYIKAAKTRDHISNDKIVMIEKWKGLTVREALERHGQ